MRFDEFDRRMRRFECSLDRHLSPEQFYVARLDGRGFTKLTKEKIAFARPFDQRFHDSMLHTCRHLMTCGFQVGLCYTQSDEISLLLDKGSRACQAKERKIVSLLAGEASSTFSLAIGHQASFDCRLCPLPAVEYVIDYFRWRSQDARRNALSAYCYWALRANGMSPSDTDRELDGLSSEAKRALLFQHGIDFDAQEDWKRLGAFLRWDQIMRPGRNPVTGEDVMASRRHVVEVVPSPDGSQNDAMVASLATS